MFHGAAHELVARMAEQLLALRVRQLNHALPVDHHQPVRSELEHAAEELLGFEQLLALCLRLPEQLLRAQVALQDLEAHRHQRHQFASSASCRESSEPNVAISTTPNSVSLDKSGDVKTRAGVAAPSPDAMRR